MATMVSLNNLTYCSKNMLGYKVKRQRICQGVTMKNAQNENYSAWLSLITR